MVVGCGVGMVLVVIVVDVVDAGSDGGVDVVFVLAVCSAISS